jgi:hypothetical protein
VDGFDQDQRASEGDNGAEAFCGFFASQGDALESLELAHRLLDAGAGFVEQLGKEAGPVFGVGAVWDDRDDAALAAAGAVGG